MSSETSLPWLVQNKPSAPIRRVENKVEFLERQFHSEKLSFVHKKETEHSFELSLSICVFYRRIFNLEMQNFSLENRQIMNARQPFCWWMTFSKVSNPFLPSPPKCLTWPLDVCRGVGMGDFTDFVGIGSIFSETSLVSLHSRRLEVVGTRKNGRARRKHAREEETPARKAHENRLPPPT